MVQTPDGRILVTEQWGRVMVIETANCSARVPRHPPPADRPDFDERGLLGLALHPDFANNGKLVDWEGPPRKDVSSDEQRMQVTAYVLSPKVSP